MMRMFLYWLVQCLWGLPQTLLGLMVFLLHLRDEHFIFHGAVITRWKGRSSVSIGPFVFVTADPFFCDRYQGQYTREVLARRLLVHEYGHTIQSLILGPLYLIVMGIPSTVWGWLPSLARMRREKQRSYFSFFTERWANRLGEWVIGEESMGQLLID